MKKNQISDIKSAMNYISFEGWKNRRRTVCKTLNRNVCKNGR